MAISTTNLGRLALIICHCREVGDKDGSQETGSFGKPSVFHSSQSELTDHRPVEKGV